MGYQQKEITDTVLSVLKKTESADGKSRMELRVTSWNYAQPTLELRSFYQKEGKWLFGKSHGLRAEDVEVIIEKQEFIKKMLAIKGKDALLARAEARKAKLSKAA